MHAPSTQSNNSKRTLNWQLAVMTLAAFSWWMPHEGAWAQTAPPSAKPAEGTISLVGEKMAAAGLLKGYLTQAQLPNSLSLLPAPPVAGTTAQAEDESRYLATRALMKGQRGVLAAQDANLNFPHPEQAFACTLGFEPDPAKMPKLMHVLQRSFTDAALATYAAKNHYQRVRPFVVNDSVTCTPDEDAVLAKDGSYPSGHTAIGWTFALILSELFPERADALLKRGFEFGQSRVICAAHWQSDVTQGRVVGAGVVARLHAEPQFRADLMEAASELPAAIKTASAPKRDCAWEAKALAEVAQ